MFDTIRMTGDAVKSYLTDVHITMLSSIRVTAQNLLDNMTLYKAGYCDIDNFGYIGCQYARVKWSIRTT